MICLRCSLGLSMEGGGEKRCLIPLQTLSSLGKCEFHVCGVVAENVRWKIGSS